MKSFFARVLVLWLPILVATSGAFVFAYWGIQQEYRMSLNDPQIQLAEDAAASLASGSQVDQVVPVGKVDLRASLAPWVAVYTATGVPLLASGELDGAPPQLPLGVFATSTWHTYAAYGVPVKVPPGEDRFSWQPRSDVRQAVVLVAVDSGGVHAFVAAGRNMREVEAREAVLTHGAALAWAGTELGTFIVISILLALG